MGLIFLQNDISDVYIYKKNNIIFNLYTKRQR